MKEEAEQFRKITMRVLIMQLNSISIMDLVAYGGAAAGIISMLTSFQNGTVTLFGALFIVLMSAEFFIPMRTLGSYFHIAMNGMAASDTMFQLFDLEENEHPIHELAPFSSLKMENLSFAYEEKPILKDLSLSIKKGEKIAFVGESGSGKSTIAHLMMGILQPQKGSVR